jgi:hypothetical protein
MNATRPSNFILLHLITLIQTGEEFKLLSSSLFHFLQSHLTSTLLGASLNFTETSAYFYFNTYSALTAVQQIFQSSVTDIVTLYQYYGGNPPLSIARDTKECVIHDLLKVGCVPVFGFSLSV